MISVQNLHKSFDGQHVLRGITLDVATGEIMIIIGRSGEGKSVFLRHLLGLLRPDSGHIIFKPHHIELITDDLSLYEALGSLQEYDNFPRNKLTKLLEVVHVSSFRERTKKEKPILTEERVEVLRKIALQGKSSNQ